MTSLLLHCCCAPCSLSCIDPLREEGFTLTAFWYNPNIHPWKEYQARRDCLLTYAPTIGLEVRVQENYGLREFVRQVAGNIDGRCAYCYGHRLEGTARYAAETAFPPLPLLSWPASIRTTRPLPGPQSTGQSTTEWSSSTGISAPTSAPATSGPGNWAFTCRNTVAASFLKKTAMPNKLRGTGKNFSPLSRKGAQKNERQSCFL